MTTYDDNETFAVGDPTDIDWDKVEQLQKKIDKLNKIENPIAKDKALKAFFKELNHG